MGVDSFQLPPRSLRFLLILGFTCMLVLPLYKLRDHDAARHYKQYFYDHLTQFLDEDQCHKYYNKNSTTHRQGSEPAAQPPSAQPATIHHTQSNVSSSCPGFPETDGIMLVMKTGGTEAFDKVPTQLLSGLQCLPDFLLFSDLEQKIGKYQIHNVLDRVKDTVKTGLAEFDLYDAQQTCPVSQKECTSDMKGGWDLDKYKFLHMVIRTWEMRPGREWYVFAEADTYIFWPNLVHWLRNKVDPRDQLYIGSVALINDYPFAHGGSGYVISGKLMEKLVAIPDLAAKYDAMAPNECCGDLLISMAAQEAGTKVKQVHPMFNGEKPNTLPFGNGHWCEPLMTLHHVNSEEVSALWNFEQTRIKKGVMQIKEIYDAFFKPQLVRYRKDWDNLSDDICYVGPDEGDQNQAPKIAKERQKKEDEKNPVEKRAHTSPAACAKVCESKGLDIDEAAYAALDTEQARGDLIHAAYDAKANSTESFRKGRDCFQWRYQNKACCIAKSFKLGKPRKEKREADTMMSGWFVKGINHWIEAQGDCDLKWKEPK